MSTRFNFLMKFSMYQQQMLDSVTLLITATLLCFSHLVRPLRKCALFALLRFDTVCQISINELTALTHGTRNNWQFRNTHRRRQNKCLSSPAISTDVRVKTIFCKIRLLTFWHIFTFQTNNNGLIVNFKKVPVKCRRIRKHLIIESRRVLHEMRLGREHTVTCKPPQCPLITLGNGCF